MVPDSVKREVFLYQTAQQKTKKTPADSSLTRSVMRTSFVHSSYHGMSHEGVPIDEPVRLVQPQLDIYAEDQTVVVSLPHGISAYQVQSTRAQQQ
jgi:hypothetical protein